MTVMKLEENIKKMSEELEKMKIETYRLEGSLKMLIAIKEGGIEELDLPNIKEEEKEKEK
jgi:hypothetical protein